MPFFVQNHIILFALAVGAAFLVLLILWIQQLRRAVSRRTAQLQKSQRQLRILFDAIPDTIVIKNRQGTIIEANRRTLMVDGIAETVIGKTAVDLLPADTARELAAVETDVMQSGKAHFVLANRVAKNDVMVSEEISVIPLHDDEGRITGTLAVIHDVTERMQMESRLRLWAHAIQHADFGIALIDFATNRVAAANDSFAFGRGYSPDEMIGLSLAALHTEGLQADRFQQSLQSVLDEHQIIETEHVRRNGERFPVLLDCSLFRDERGQPRYIVMYAQDISEHKKAQSELRLAAVSFETHDATVVLDEEGRVQRMNAAFRELTGYGESEVIGRKAFFLDEGMHDARFVRALQEELRDNGRWKGELWIRVRQGKPRVARVHVSAVPGETGRPSHYVCAFVDLTQEREAHARADRLSFFDALTDLPNRNYLFGQLGHLMEEQDSSGGVLLVIDLDHFKRINDLQGHAMGDHLLGLVAQRLRACQGDNDTVARLSGGVFAWLSARISTRQVDCERTAADCARRVRTALADPFILNGPEQITITASIGWSCFIPGRSSPETILQEAELAMYAAKENGRNQVRRFQPVMQEIRTRQERLLGALRAAVADPVAGGMFLQAQPQYDRKGKIAAVEFLLRWRHEDGRMDPPDHFIALAEADGLIESLGCWVLQQACRCLAAWKHQTFTRELSVAVNVSPHQFTRPDFVSLVGQTLLEYDVDPARLTLELTESALLGDLAEIAAKLGELRALGLRISLDDFGTGYSSLSWLSRLPIDELKIDRTFISRLPHDKVDAMVAGSVITMARGLGLRVIAEGVETEAQREWLLQRNCDLLQGYLLARPMSLDRCEAFLKEAYLCRPGRTGVQLQRRQGTVPG